MSISTETVRGCKIAIDYDEFGAEQPYEDDDAVRIVVLHRRYINPAKGWADTPEEVAERETDAEWIAFPLFMYDHSGTAYRVSRSGGNPFCGRLPQGHAEFDSGRVGSIFLKRDEWGSKDATDDDYFRYAEGIAEAYEAWANGRVYCWTVTAPDESDFECVGGYYDLDEALEEARSAARSMADDIKNRCAPALEELGEHIAKVENGIRVFTKKRSGELPRMVLQSLFRDRRNLKSQYGEIATLYALTQ